MTELKRFEQWWDAGDDIPNDGPYTPDTPIQFAWAGWQAALAQPEQEPVGQLLEDAFGRGQVMWFDKPVDGSYVYTTPPQRTWVGLEAEDRLCAKYMQDAPDGIEAVIDYIEAKLKEKNT